MVVSSLDDLGHVFQGTESRLPGQNVGGQSLQAAAGCLRLLRTSQVSKVLPTDQPQRVLQVGLPQRRLQTEMTYAAWWRSSGTDKLWPIS